MSADPTLLEAIPAVDRPLHLDGGAFAPAVRPEQLGDASFRTDHGLRYAYLAGAMANGIGSTDIVAAMANAGMLGFFGAARLGLDRVEQAIDRVQRDVPDRPHGFNLIHSPHEPRLEAGVVELYLRRKVQLVEASAYLDLTLPVVRFRTAGIHQTPDGRIVAPNRVIAKVSRVEVADDMRAVFSYDVIIDAIKMILSTGHIAMVETIAERLAESVLLHERVRAVTVQVEKLDVAPGAVGVKIRRERAHVDARRIAPAPMRADAGK